LKEDTAETGFISTRRSIVYDQHVIGSVEISVSTRGITNTLMNSLMLTLLTILVVDFSIQLATRLWLNRYLNRPLKSLIQGVDSIASGSDYQSLAPVPQAELNEIVQGINRLAHQIRERVESLRMSEERFRQVVTSISDMIYMTEITPTGKRINHYVSPHAEILTGYPVSRFMDDFQFWPTTLVHPDDRPLSVEKWQRLSNDQSSEIEYRLIRQDQTYIWVRDSTRVGKYGDKRMVYGVISDITERKKVEAALRAETAERKLAEKELLDYQERLEDLVSARTAELEAVNKELESFAYTISHDLRSPLRHMDGYSQMVIEDFGQIIPPQGHQYLERVRHGVQRMSDLIDGLLKFSRLSRHPLNLQPVEPRALIERILDDLKVDQNQRQIDFRIGNLPPCQADQLLLGQVYTNLISNAIKYSCNQEKAVIEIGSDPREQGLIYFVRDNGIGIDMQYSDKLFGVFQRLHTDQEMEGTGVGLAIVKRIIQRHGGRIWVESALHQGSTFYFTLPQVPDPTFV
jgi:PAS domain S-box-containing protein